MPLQRILLTTDFSDCAREAYGPAGELARRFDAALHLVHVAENLNPALPGMSVESCLGELGEALENEARDFAFEQVQVKPCLLNHRRPQDALLQFEREERIDLAVTAALGRTGASYFLLGSFAERLLRTSAAPVLAYRRRQGGKDDLELNSILVPIDFTGPFRRILPAVRFLTSHFHPRITFLDVYELGPRGVPLHDKKRRAMKSARAVAERRFEELEKSLPGVDAAFEFTSGVPSLDILRRGRELAADLILIGAYGTLGHLSPVIAREASGPVLAIPRAGATRAAIPGAAAGGAPMEFATPDETGKIQKIGIGGVHREGKR